MFLSVQIIVSGIKLKLSFFQIVMVDVKANGYIYNPVNDELIIIRFLIFYLVCWLGESIKRS